jgi:hypothetical protein
MMTARVRLPGPFAWYPTWRRHRSFRFSFTYWALSLWAVELVFWLVAGTLIAVVCVLRIIGPHLLKAGYGMLVGLRIAAKVMLHV